MTRLLTLLALPALLLTGCGSNGPDAACASAGFEATGSLSATAGGEAFSAACMNATFSNGAFVVAGIENLGAAGASQRQISFTVMNPQTGSNQAVVATYADIDLANPTAGTYAATNATIQFDAFSSTAAEGSFSFTARNNGGQTVQVTNGRFDLSY